MSISLDIQLEKTNKTFNEGDVLRGRVLLNSQSETKVDGLQIICEGFVALQVSNKNTGVFDAFYNSVNKPITLLNMSLDLLQPGSKVIAGISEFPFEFPLKSKGADNPLYETYHGVFVSISYFLKAQLKRKYLAKDCQAKTQFFLQNRPIIHEPSMNVPIHFSLSPESLQRSSKEKISIPRFLITGTIESKVFCINSRMTGFITVHHSEIPIKSVEIQLIRVETAGCAEGFSNDATEIQNIQIVDGNVCAKQQVPIHMTFPRLFTCPSLQTRNFKINFELNLVIIFKDDNLITENFPLQLIRTQ